MKTISDRNQGMIVLVIWLVIIVCSCLKFGLVWGVIIGLWPGALPPLFLLVVSDYITYRDYYLGRIDLPDLA